MATTRRPPYTPTDHLDLSGHGITVGNVVRNASVPLLYELAVRRSDAAITSSGALATLSGDKTGRSPKDKRIARESESEGDIWWGEVNIPLDQRSWRINHQRAIDFLNTRKLLYVFDGFAGWDERYRLKVRIVCAKAYHALFMHNMLIRPTDGELADFGTPDFTIYNAGDFPANVHTEGMTSPTSVDVSFAHREMVILGTNYAGEMKKGVFTVMNYLMPAQDVLSMHCSCNQAKDDDGDVTLFFGLSGTGKTTLSADPRRLLVGDDEHCWTDHGIFNIEGGCYAKTIDLSREKEPEIYAAIHFGSVLENVVLEDESRDVDYGNHSITDNMRTAYPIEFIRNAKIPCVAGHPKNIVLLTCDASGVLPPVSRLTPEQAMYHFISGYTAKIPGTEEGVTEPKFTFSACFGAPFLVWHPSKYADLLADRMRSHGSAAWLVNTGWTGGSYPDAARIDLKHTRAVIDAIHDGSLADAPTETDPVFGMEVPTRCPGVPDEVLVPEQAWHDAAAYRKHAEQLAERFRANFAKFADVTSPEVKQAGP